jgi:hypothetical protein
MLIPAFIAWYQCCLQYIESQTITITSSWPVWFHGFGQFVTIASYLSGHSSFVSMQVWRYDTQFWFSSVQGLSHSPFTPLLNIGSLLSTLAWHLVSSVCWRYSLIHIFTHFSNILHRCCHKMAASRKWYSVIDPPKSEAFITGCMHQTQCFDATIGSSFAGFSVPFVSNIILLRVTDTHLSCDLHVLNISWINIISGHFVK